MEEEKKSPRPKVISLKDKLEDKLQKDEDKARKEAIDRILEQAKKLTW